MPTRRGYCNCQDAALITELNNLQAKFDALLAKLDLDGTVTDTNYAALLGSASAGGFVGLTRSSSANELISSPT